MNATNLDGMFNKLLQESSNMQYGSNQNLLLYELPASESNAVVKTWQLQNQEAEAEQRAEFKSWEWHSAILLCAIAVVALLWRISSQMKSKSSFGQQYQNKTNENQPTNHALWNEKRQEANKPPILKQTLQNQPPCAIAKAVPDGSCGDAKYLPKV
jgi:hypothetical protein